MAAIKSSYNRDRKRRCADLADKSSRNEHALDGPIVGRIEEKVEEKVDDKGRKHVVVVHDDKPASAKPVCTPADIENAANEVLTAPQAPKTAPKATPAAKTASDARAQLAVLDDRLGKGQGAAKERAKLMARIK